MNARFICPGCDQSIEAPASIRGQSVSCPTCSQTFIVPKVVTWTEPIVLLVLGFAIVFIWPIIEIPNMPIRIAMMLAGPALIIYGLAKAFYVASKRHGILAAIAGTLGIGGIAFMLIAWLAAESLPGLFVGGVLTLLGGAFLVGALIKKQQS